MQERGAYRPRVQMAGDYCPGIVWDECVLSSSDEEHTCSYHQHHHIIVTTSRMQLFGCITFVVFCWVEPTAMPQRLWEKVNRPQWAREQARRLDEGHFAQLRIHEDWCKQEREGYCDAQASSGELGLGGLVPS